MQEERHLPNTWKEVLNKMAAMLRKMGYKTPLYPENFEETSHKVRLGISDKDVTVTLEETIAAYKKLRTEHLLFFPIHLAQ